MKKLRLQKHGDLWLLFGAAFTAVTPRNRLRREEGDGQFRDVRVRSVGSGSDEDKGGETAI